MKILSDMNLDILPLYEEPLYVEYLNRYKFYSDRIYKFL